MDYCNSALDPYRPQYIYFWRVFQMKLIMRSIQMNSLGGRCYLTQPRADWYCRFYEREFCLSVVFFFFFLYGIRRTVIDPIILFESYSLRNFILPRDLKKKETSPRKEI